MELKTRPEYIKIKTALQSCVSNPNLIDKVTLLQATNILGTTGQSGLIPNILTRIKRDLEDERMQNILKGLKEQLIGGDRTWLLNNFPKAEIIVEKAGKIRVVIWPFGRPEVSE